MASRSSGRCRGPSARSPAGAAGRLRLHRDGRTAGRPCHRPPGRQRPDRHRLGAARAARRRAPQERRAGHARPRSPAPPRRALPHGPRPRHRPGRARRGRGSHPRGDRRERPGRGRRRARRPRLQRPRRVRRPLKFGRLLADGRGLGTVEPAFVSVARPDVPGALERCRLLGARTIVVAPLLLFTGVLVPRIYRQAQDWAAEHPEIDVRAAAHLGPDPRLARLVLERHREAVFGDVRMNCDLCTYRVRLPSYEDKVGMPISLTPHGDAPARGKRRSRRATRAPLAPIDSRRAARGCARRPRSRCPKGRRAPRSTCEACASPTPTAARRSRGSTCRSPSASAWRCSAPTAPARPRSCSSSTACSRAATGRSASAASSSRRARAPRSRRRVGHRLPGLRRPALHAQRARRRRLRSGEPRPARGALRERVDAALEQRRTSRTRPTARRTSSPPASGGARPWPACSRWSPTC